MATIQIVGVAKGEIPVPDRHRRDLAAAILAEVIAQPITVDLFREFQDPELIHESVHVHVVRVMIGAGDREIVVAVNGLFHGVEEPYEIILLICAGDGAF